MQDLTPEQIEDAIATLDLIVQSRKVTQQQLAALSQVSQPTIAHIIHRTRPASREQLTKLFDALGLKLESILDLDEPPARISGYLATPLTAIVKEAKKEDVLYSVVGVIKEIARSPELTNRRSRCIGQATIHILVRTPTSGLKPSIAWTGPVPEQATSS